VFSMNCMSWYCTAIEVCLHTFFSFQWTIWVNTFDQIL